MSRGLFFNSLPIEDGLLYTLRDPDDQPWLYKVDFNGKLIDSVSLIYQQYKLFGTLCASGNKYFLVGEAQPPFQSFFQTFRDRRACVAIFDKNLELENIYLYNNLPENSGWIQALETGSLGTRIQPVGGAVVRKDTVYMVKNYSYFDTLDFSGRGFDRVLERYILGKDALPSKSVKQTTNTVYAVVYTDEDIYLYGQSIAGNGQAADQTGAVGKYTYSGRYLRNEKFIESPSFEFDPVFESIGNRFGSEIFSCYVDGGNLDPLCASTVLDVRDLQFQLKKRVKIQECGWAPSGARCVASNGKDHFILLKDLDGNLGLIKYNQNLDIIWSRFLSFSLPHTGIGISATPDGGVVLDCIIRGQQEILKLYKVNSNGEIISNTPTPEFQSVLFKLYPNPFSERLYVESLLPAPANIEVLLTDLMGRILFQQPLTSNTIDLPGNLVSGMFCLQMKDIHTGKLLHQQWLTCKAP